MGWSRRSDLDRFLGHRIKQLRLRACMSQQQVARQLGVSTQQVHKYEKGINHLSADRLLAIARSSKPRLGISSTGMAVVLPLDPLVDLKTTRMLLNVTHSFLELEPKRQDALLRLVQALAAED
jgi:transcriptional regulator with XRE-family HTH domain